MNQSKLAMVALTLAVGALSLSACGSDDDKASLGDGSGVPGFEFKTTNGPMNSVGRKELSVACSAGKNVIGGGAVVLGSGVALSSSAENGRSAWGAIAYEPVATSSSWGLKVWAYCADTGGL